MNFFSLWLQCKGEMKKDEDISGAKFALYGCSKLEDMK